MAPLNEGKGAKISRIIKRWFMMRTWGEKLERTFEASVKKLGVDRDNWGPALAAPRDRMTSNPQPLTAKLPKPTKQRTM